MAQSTLSNLVLLAAYIDSGVMEVLRTTNVALGFMYTVNFQPGSDSKKMRKRNAQTAAVVTEGSQATAAAFGHTAQNTLQAKKIVVLNELTEEAELFGGLEIDEVRTEQGQAISEKIDVDSCSNFSSFTNVANATGVDLTIDKLAEAEYKAGLSYAPGDSIFVLGNVQLWDVKKDLITTAAPVWSNPVVSSLLEKQPNPQNGFKGQILGHDVYMTNHTPTSGGDRVGACIVPGYALAYASIRPADTILQAKADYRTTLVSTDFYFDVKIRFDTAGCAIQSSNT